MKVLISIVCFTLLYCQSVNTKEWNGRTLKRFYQENTGLINHQTNIEYQKRWGYREPVLPYSYGINAKNVQVNENVDTQNNHFSKKRFTQLNRDKILNGSTLTKRMNIKMIGPVVNLMSEQRGQSTGSGGLDLQTIGIVKNSRVLEDNTYQRPQPQNRFQPQYQQGQQNGFQPQYQQGQQNRNQQNNYVEYHKTNVHYQKRFIQKGLGKINEYRRRFNQVNSGEINTQINKEYQKRFNQVNSGKINTQINKEYQKRLYYGINAKNVQVNGNVDTQNNHFSKKRFTQLNRGKINTQTNEEYQKRFHQAHPGLITKQIGIEFQKVNQSNY